MPNWCNNVIEAKSADTEKLKAFKDFAKDFTLRKVVPIPDDMVDNESWRIDNWGCKWDIDPQYTHFWDNHNPNEFNISFETPWNPVSIGFIKQLRKLFPGIEIKRYYSRS